MFRIFTVVKRRENIYKNLKEIIKLKLEKIKNKWILKNEKWEMKLLKNNLIDEINFIGF